MKKNWLEKDRVIPKVNNILSDCTSICKCDIRSLVLYGSRVRDGGSQNEYEFLLLIDEISTNSYIHLINLIKIELLKQKLMGVNITVHTQKSFEELLYNTEDISTLLYMIIREHLILFDKQGSFISIKERLLSNTIKPEEEFLNQCIRFAKKMGSIKWEQKWEKVLMQYKYLHRRDI